jgi:hypothetical protein
MYIQAFKGKSGVPDLIWFGADDHIGGNRRRIRIYIRNTSFRYGQLNFKHCGFSVFADSDVSGCNLRVIDSCGDNIGQIHLWFLP